MLASKGLRSICNGEVCKNYMLLVKSPGCYLGFHRSQSQPVWR